MAEGSAAAEELRALVAKAMWRWTKMWRSRGASLFWKGSGKMMEHELKWEIRWRFQIFCSFFIPTRWNDPTWRAYFFNRVVKNPPNRRSWATKPNQKAKWLFEDDSSPMFFGRMRNDSTSWRFEGRVLKCHDGNPFLGLQDVAKWLETTNGHTWNSNHQFFKEHYKV